MVALVLAFNPGDHRSPLPLSGVVVDAHIDPGMRISPRGDVGIPPYTRTIMFLCFNLSLILNLRRLCRIIPKMFIVNFIILNFFSLKGSFGMDIMPISVVIFGVIPEAILVVWAGLTMLSKKPDFKRLVLVGVLQGICTYYTRRYIDFGPHMVIQFIILIALIVYILKVNLMTAFLAMLISFTIVVLVEGSTTVLLKADMVYVLSMGWKRILFLLPHNIILASIIYICNRYNESLLSEFSFLNKIVK